MCGGGSAPPFIALSILGAAPQLSSWITVYSSWTLVPTLGSLDHCFFELRPVVQSGWIEIRPIRPDERVNLRVQRNSVEDVDIPQWRVQLAG